MRERTRSLIFPRLPASQADLRFRPSDRTLLNARRYGTRENKWKTVGPGAANRRTGGKDDFFLKEFLFN